MDNKPVKVLCTSNIFFVPGDTREHRIPLTPGKVYDVIPTTIEHPGSYLILNDNDEERRYAHDRFDIVDIVDVESD